MNKFYVVSWEDHEPEYFKSKEKAISSAVSDIIDNTLKYVSQYPDEERMKEYEQTFEDIRNLLVYNEMRYCWIYEETFRDNEEE